MPGHRNQNALKVARVTGSVIIKLRLAWVVLNADGPAECFYDFFDNGHSSPCRIFR